MAILATFDATSGTLSVFGDSLDNNIVLSRDAAGVIHVNGGAVDITGGSPTVANTALMQVFAQGGNDTVILDEANGALPRANLFGGADHDILVGGSGGDQLFGQSGTIRSWAKAASISCSAVRTMTSSPAGMPTIRSSARAVTTG